MKADKLFDDISQFVKESRELLAAGAYTEMAGLDERVRALCGQMLHLTQDERVQNAARLQTLLEELGALGTALVVQRDKLAGEAVQLAQHKKASTAYRTAESRDNFGERDGEE